jgi:anti-sigma regulatory factor (Ser/Thr protein kinase)
VQQFTLSNIHNDINGYNQLAKLYQTHKDDTFETINIEIRQWLDANLCAVLGGILDKIQANANNVVFSFIKNDIQTILQKNGFLESYGYPRVYDNYNTTVEYTKLKPTDSRYFNDYLENNLLKRVELPTMSEAVHDKINESIQEMFVNAKIHSESQFIYTCGQFFPKDHKINFTIADTGIGFAKRIEKNFGKKISSTEAIRWALIDGNTTKQGVSGGLGLALLKEFITENNGKIQLISGNAFYELCEGKESIDNLDYFYDGSVVSITFKTDDRKSYRLKSEDIDINDIF